MTIALMILGCGLLWTLRREAGNSTLFAPWIWAFVALIAIGVAESIAAWRPNEWRLPHVRYLAAILSLCPLTAVLGAKRPQHQAWQFVVVCLLLVLASPVAEAMVFSPGGALAVRGLRSWFLAGLVAVGIFNFAATRFWPSCLLAATGQILLIGEHLPGEFLSHASWKPAAALGCFLAGLALLALGFPAARKAEHPADRAWLDFRDAFGALWGLRVAERFNAAAEQYDYGGRLRWHGLDAEILEADVLDPESLRPDDPANERELPENMRRVLENLLQRFVSREWLRDRLGSEDVSPRGKSDG